MDATSRLIDSTQELANLYRDQREHLSKELERVKAERDKYHSAILNCLEENAHLADGEDCTLINLKRALI